MFPLSGDHRPLNQPLTSFPPPTPRQERGLVCCPLQPGLLCCRWTTPERHKSSRSSPPRSPASARRQRRRKARSSAASLSPWLAGRSGAGSLLVSVDSAGICAAGSPAAPSSPWLAGRSVVAMHGSLAARSPSRLWRTSIPTLRPRAHPSLAAPSASTEGQDPRER